MNVHLYFKMCFFIIVIKPDIDRWTEKWDRREGGEKEEGWILGEGKSPKWKSKCLDKADIYYNREGLIKLEK